MSLARVRAHPAATGLQRVHVADPGNLWRGDLHGKPCQEPFGYPWITTLCGKNLFTPQWPKFKPRVDCAACRRELERRRNAE
jgi:hypothetical protein